MKLVRLTPLTVKVKQRNAMVKLNISNEDARLSKLQTLPCKMPPQAVNSTGATPSAHKAWRDPIAPNTRRHSQVYSC